MDDIVGKMTEHARQVFGQSDLEYCENQVFRDLSGFDSVRAVQYILAIERSCNVLFHGDEIDSMRTMGNMLALIRSKTMNVNE